MIPQSDQLIESVYDLINAQPGEYVREQVARTALLAAEYRAQQLARARMQAANDKRMAARAALKTASTRDGGEHRSDYPAGRLSPVQPGEGEAQ
jgi:hypothetical protein